MADVQTVILHPASLTASELKILQACSVKGQTSKEITEKVLGHLFVVIRADPQLVYRLTQLCRYGLVAYQRRPAMWSTTEDGLQLLQNG
jgi:hypothetical protein